MGFPYLLSRLDEAGVERAVIMVREVDEGRLGVLARRHPRRIVPFIGGRLFQASLQRGSHRRKVGGVRHYRGFREEWWRSRGEAVFRAMEKGLRSGGFRGVGEIRLKHRGFGPGVPEMKCDYDFEMDSPVILRLLRLAGRYRVPMTVHLEVDVDRRRRLDTFSRALRLVPETPVVWAHAGPCDAATLDRMLGAHPNLSAEIMPLVRNTYVHKVPYLRTFPPLTDRKGRLLTPWRRVLARRAGRLLVGSDCRTVPEYRHLRTRMEDMRGILAQLPGAAAEKIAHQNADRLFRGGR
jgi:predicted TIM-barrel fold metal-dependent hydrolase